MSLKKHQLQLLESKEAEEVLQLAEKLYSKLKTYGPPKKVLSACMIIIVSETYASGLKLEALLEAITMLWHGEQKLRLEQKH